jgi:hypothetical protein
LLSSLKSFHLVWSIWSLLAAVGAVLTAEALVALVGIAQVFLVNPLVAVLPLNCHLALA